MQTDVPAPESAPAEGMTAPAVAPGPLPGIAQQEGSEATAAAMVPEPAAPAVGPMAAPALAAHAPAFAVPLPPATAAGGGGGQQADPKAAFEEAWTQFQLSEGLDIKIPLFNRHGIDLYKLFILVLKAGGFEVATAGKKWASIGRAFNPPSSMTDLSYQIKKIYIARLQRFEEAYRAGEVVLQLPLDAPLPPAPTAGEGAGAAKPKPKAKPKAGRAVKQEPSGAVEPTPPPRQQRRRRAASLPTSAAALADPAALVGQRVGVLWESERQYFFGTVAQWNEDEGVHFVNYDDGDSEWLDLGSETWVLESEAGPVLAAMAQEAAAAGAVLQQGGFGEGMGPASKKARGGSETGSGGNKLEAGELGQQAPDQAARRVADAAIAGAAAAAELLAQAGAAGALGMPLRGPMPMPTAPSLDLAGSEPLFGGDAKGGGDAALGGLPPAQLAGPLRAAYQLSAAPQPMLLPQQALFGNMAPAAAGGGLGLGDGGNGGLGVPPLPPGYQRRREGELGLGFGDPLAEPLHPPLHSAGTQQLVATGDAYRAFTTSTGPPGFEVFCLLPGITLEQVKVRCWFSGRMVIKTDAPTDLSAYVPHPGGLSNWAPLPPAAPFTELEILLPGRLDTKSAQALFTTHGHLYIRVNLKDV